MSRPLIKFVWDMAFVLRQNEYVRESDNLSRNQMNRNCCPLDVERKMSKKRKGTNGHKYALAFCVN